LKFKMTNREFFEWSWAHDNNLRIWVFLVIAGLDEMKIQTFYL
jgi:hypothetical protein